MAWRSLLSGHHLLFSWNVVIRTPFTFTGSRGQQHTDREMKVYNVVLVKHFGFIVFTYFIFEDQKHRVHLFLSIYLYLAVSLSHTHILSQLWCFYTIYITAARSFSTFTCFVITAFWIKWCCHFNTSWVICILLMKETSCDDTNMTNSLPIQHLPPAQSEFNVTIFDQLKKALFIFI